MIKPAKGSCLSSFPYMENRIKTVFDGALPRQKHLPLAPTKEAGAEERSRRDEREYIKREPSEAGLV